MHNHVCLVAIAITIAPLLCANTDLAKAGTIIVQPGPGEGKDIWTTSTYSYAGGGGGPGGGRNDEELVVGGWSDYYHSLIEFDLGGLPSKASSVQLELYNSTSRSGRTVNMYLDRIVEPWDWRTQGTGPDRERLWWADRPATEPYMSGLSAPKENAWYSIDITNLYNSWQSGALPNYGIQLRPTGNTNNWNEFYSSDYLDNPLLRPKLTITEEPLSPDTLTLNAPFYSDRPHYLTQGTNTTFSHKDLLANDLDFSLHGSEVIASAAGTVRFHSNTQFGNYATVDHGVSPFSADERLFTVYAHLEDDTMNSALEGAIAGAGTFLGLEGATGATFGAIHIHYGVYSGDPVKDPFLESGSWNSVGIDGNAVVFEADVTGDGTIELFTNGAMFDPFVCENNVYIEACRFYSLLERPQSLSFSGLIQEGETYGYTLSVDAGFPIEAILTWPGSELMLDVFDPQGMLWASLSETDGLISFSEKAPALGTWSFLVTGIETNEAGEPFSFYATSLSSIPEPRSSSVMLVGMFAFFSIRLLARREQATGRRLITTRRMLKYLSDPSIYLRIGNISLCRSSLPPLEGNEDARDGRGQPHPSKPPCIIYA